MFTSPLCKAFSKKRKRENGEGVAGANKKVDEADLRDLCCPTERVCKFVNAVCRKCFPLATFWGSRHNQSAFLSAVTRYIQLRRGETLMLSQVVHRIRTKEIPWMNVAHENHLKERAEEDAKDHAAAFSQLAAAFLNRIVFWMYESFINPMLSSYFYITEAEGRGTEVLFYRKPIWFRILQKAKENMDDHFMQVRTIKIFSSSPFFSSSGELSAILHCVVFTRCRQMAFLRAASHLYLRAPTPSRNLHQRVDHP